MSESLGRFLVRLVKNRKLMLQFIDNPGADPGYAKLSPEDQAAVASQDSRRLMQALAATGKQFGEVSLKPGPKAAKRAGARKKNTAKRTSRRSTRKAR
jgi:hypothetical protein